VIRGRLAFAWGGSWRHRLAVLLLLAAVVYPGFALVTVSAWPRVPTFGVPCPTTLFTAGCLLSAKPPFRRGLLVIPLLWSVIGGSAALLLGVGIDLTLFAAAAGLLILAVAPGVLDRPSPGAGPGRPSDDPQSRDADSDPQPPARASRSSLRPLWCPAWRAGS
jgi:hypothetical protein